jgi:hypothetical protein
MKKFIIKTSFFVTPFLLFYFINAVFYRKNEGDLARLGYIYNNPSPSSEVVAQQKPLEKKYIRISETDFDQNIKVDILTIGDSFSEQRLVGYQNILANKGLSVAHVDRFLSEENPIQVLIELINSDFFDKIKTEYVVLETVERYAFDRTSELSFTQSKSIESIKTQIKEYEEKKLKTTNSEVSQKLEFFSDATVKIPLFNFQYLFLNRPLHSDIYCFKSNTNLLFSNNPKDLLFYKDDIKTLSAKNDDKNVSQVNKIFNEINQLLEKKGIKLIVMIAPDKYDLYYPYIKNKPKGKEPLFFEKLEKEKKEYLYIPSYSILSDMIKKEKDVYFYDDTHWTMKGSEAMSESIYNMIQNKKAVE